MIEYVKRTQKPTERASNGQSWSNFSNNINNIALDYNLMDKTNTVFMI